MEALTAQIVALVAHELGCNHPTKPAPEVTAESLLVEDLGCDAIDIVCLTVAVEEALGVDISDAAAESWRDVRDIAASVAALREVV